MPDVSRITFVDREISDERLRFSETLYYCPVCVSENDLPAENHKMPAQEFSAVYKKVGGSSCLFRMLYRIDFLNMGCGAGFGSGLI